MPSERVTELMYDTASALRLLDAELDELAPRQAAGGTSAVDDAADAGSRADDADAHTQTHTLVPALFVRATREVHAMLESIRSGREHLRDVTTERLAPTSETLDEVSSATASAAIDIMDALERAVAKLDELDSDVVRADAGAARAIRNDVRDELFGVMHHMQFQDITSQQITHVQTMLADMESRLAAIATLFDGFGGASTNPADTSPSARPWHDTRLGDTRATLTDAELRQAMADAIVQRSAGGS